MTPVGGHLGRRRSAVLWTLAILAALALKLVAINLSADAALALAPPSSVSAWNASQAAPPLLNAPLAHGRSWRNW